MPMPSEGEPAQPHRRRRRYRGTHPRRFGERYKELNPERWPEMQDHILAQGRTPAGGHVPVLLNEVLEALRPVPGDVIADCTLGNAGHAIALLRRVAPGGRVIGFDVDGEQLTRAHDRIRAELQDSAASGVAPLEQPPAFVARRGNFAGIGHALPELGLAGYNAILADLGVSSMQIDDPARGFSYKHDGPLDMRMDGRLRRTAADLLATLTESEFSDALRELADEPDHARIAREIVLTRDRAAITRTGQLAALVERVKHRTPPRTRNPKIHPGEGSNVRKDAREAARVRHCSAQTFQALRMLVNDERGNLRQLLRIAPYSLCANGRIAIICFHSGEERLVREAFERGMADGVYAQVCPSPAIATPTERRNNPRSIAARLYWAVKQ